MRALSSKLCQRSIQLTQPEVLSGSAFQLRNLRVAHLRHDQQSEPSRSKSNKRIKLEDQVQSGTCCLRSHNPLQLTACAHAWQAHTFKASASSLAFDPSSGSILTTDSSAQHGAAASGLSFDPSSGSILTSGSNAQQDAEFATADSSHQSSEDLLQAGLGPSTAAAASQFVPRSQSTQLIGQMLRSDLAAEVQPEQTHAQAVCIAIIM